MVLKDCVEYFTYLNYGPLAFDMLNKFGAEGWQLISVVASGLGQENDKFYYYFSRPYTRQV